MVLTSLGLSLGSILVVAMVRVGRHWFGDVADVDEWDRGQRPRLHGMLRPLNTEAAWPNQINRG